MWPEALPERCRWCIGAQQRLEALREIAQVRDTRSVREIFNQLNYRRYANLRQQVMQEAERRWNREREQLSRLEEELRRYLEEQALRAMDRLLAGEQPEELERELLEDPRRGELERAIRRLKWKARELEPGDLRQTLRELEREGLIQVEGNRVSITPRGARHLARRALRRILSQLSRGAGEVYPLPHRGAGTEMLTTSRRLEWGDPYELVHVERTLLNALERTGGRLSLSPEDFEVFETTRTTRLCSGLIIDESGSMRSDGKLEAALETGLALSELMRREPKDRLRVFLFSKEVMEVSPWELLNVNLKEDITDIRAGMRAFRLAVRKEPGEKQAYLITDSEPNAEDGRFVGFNQASLGVLEEASRYRKEQITLNVIMLGQNPRLKQFAAELARRNLGRVFFAQPQDLGRVVVQDYLMTRAQLV